jgi:pimeloyl-ACP methyl ester carboxylesterase
MTGALTGAYVSVTDTRTYYEEVGDSTDQSIILVHTAGAQGSQWRHVAPILAEAGYHVLVPDLPGHGKSYPVDWAPHTTIHQHAEFVWSFVESVGLDAPVVAGCSIGGDIALDIAVNHAAELAGAIPLEGACRTRGAPLARQSHPHACPGWQDILEYSVVGSTADEVEGEILDELQWQHRGSQEVATKDLQAWADHDVTDRLDEATCPVLLVRGEDDFFVQDDVYAETVAGLPDCEGVIMPDTGHYPMMERPTRTAELVLEFLDDL